MSLWNYSRGGVHNDVRIRFAHYKSFEEAKKKWDERKGRINWDKIFIVWTYVGIDGDEEMYKRFECLPFKNKLAFINKDISSDYPSHFYIKGFEKQTGTGQLGEFNNLFGRRYYDQFDWVKWFNNN